LDREVAIKILPKEFVSRPDRLHWFQRESKTLASISHPNILAIFDVGTQGDVPYIVTELLRGQTLRECLRKGPLPRRIVIEYGTQTAKGLAAAHGKNIVHCDLKPENIFITSDNQLKILDFGLAQPAPSERTNTSSVAAWEQTTETTQLVMGTASYMSPEHVRRTRVDTRSDIFSFGAILYELLFGEVAFLRSSKIETMNAVLNEEPAKLSDQDSSLPPGWRSILRRCLEKEPERRFQCASDLAFAIEKLAEQPMTAPVRKGISGMAIGAGLIVTLALVTVSWRAAIYFRKPVDPTFRQLIFGRGYIESARFTSDGESVVYGAAFGGPRQLYLARLDGQSSRHMGLPAADLLGLSQHGEMAISLDRHNFYNWMTKGTLAIAPLSGGAPHALLADVCDGDIAPDGKDLAIVRCSGAMETLEFPIGIVLFKTTGWISTPRISPARDAIAFLEHPLLGDDRGYVSVVDMTGREKRVTEEWAGEDGLAWSLGSDEIWFTSSSQTEPQSLRAVNRSGKQRVILSTVTEVSLRDIGKDGRVLLTSMRVSTEVAMGRRNTQSVHSLDVADENAGIHGIADNGKLAALVYSGTAGGQDYKTYLAREDTPEPILLGDGDPTGISPDGKWILSILPSDPSRIVLYPTEAGESRRFSIGPVRMVTGVTSWSHDSSKVVFTGNEPGRPPRVFLLDPTSGAIRAITDEGTSDGLLTPDGEMVLAKDSTGYSVYPLQGGRRKPTKGISNADLPLQWNTSGQAIYVWDRTLPARIFRLDPTTGNRVSWMEITPVDPSGLLYGHIYISPDGQSYAYHFRRILTNLYVAQNLH
jgi:Tol biopolymer transport system component